MTDKQLKLITEFIEEEIIDEEDGGIVVMDEKQNSLATQTLTLDRIMEMAEMLSKSTIVPVAYQNRPENCFIAIDMANRMGLSPMVVMQNLYVIQGKPSFSGSAIASMIRTSSQFKDVQLNYVGEEGKDTWGAYVSAIDARNGKPLKGGTVTIMISKKEGWYQKTGSKWQTMPEIMLAYRAFAWFGRVYAPELMMGLQSTDEIEDTTTKVEVVNPYDKGGK